MDLRQLEYFLCLYEEGNVTRAARRLNVVQPALSMQLAKLEAEIGHKLFERSSKGMLPTAAGRTMFQLFMPILNDFSVAKRRMAHLGDEIVGHVSVGLIASVTQSVLSQSLAAFGERYPSVDVTVMDGYSVNFIEQVTAGQLDIAVINLPRQRLSLSSEPILQEEMVLVRGTANGAIIPDEIRLQDLAQYKLVIPSKRHGLRAVLDQAAAIKDIVLSPRLEVDALIPISDLVARTDWVTVLPSIAIHRGLADGTLTAHRIVDPPILRKLAWIYAPRHPLSPAVSKFMEIMSTDLIAAAETLNPTPAPPQPSTTTDP
jgi:DNA-binding transcriptional LysR family regulator